jgi:FkbM family methyltransferase
MGILIRKWFLSLAAWLARWLPASAKRALYQVSPLSHLIRSSLNRAAPEGLTEVEVAGGGLAGMRLALDLRSEKDYWLGTYEMELQQAIGNLVHPGMIVYDVGANIGYISLLLARAVGEAGQVFAFEALPQNVERLRANLALNEMTGRVTVVPGAVVEKARPVHFLIGPSSGTGKAEGSQGRQEIAYTASLLVEGRSLDEFIYQDRHPEPQVVKVDIEGGEVLALPGMQRLLKEARPALLLELHGPEAAQVAWDTLASTGYQLCRMAPGFPGVPSLEILDWKSYLVAIPTG